MESVEDIPTVSIMEGLPWSWETFGDYLKRLSRGLGVNVAAQVGHCAVRYYVMGKDSYERSATPEEIEKMKRVVRQAMYEGAIGFSTPQTVSPFGL